MSKCKVCGEDEQWARYKDVPLYFDDVTKNVTVEAWYCPKCDEMRAEVD